MRFNFSDLVIREDWANHYIYGVWTSWLSSFLLRMIFGMDADTATHLGSMFGVMGAAGREIYAIVTDEGEASWTDFGWSMLGAMTLNCHRQLMAM